MSVVDPKAVAAALKRSRGEERDEEATKAELAHFLNANPLPELLRDVFLATDPCAPLAAEDHYCFAESERELITLAVAAAVEPIVAEMQRSMAQLAQMIMLQTDLMRGNIHPQPDLTSSGIGRYGTVGSNTVTVFKGVTVPEE